MDFIDHSINYLTHMHLRVTVQCTRFMQPWKRILAYPRCRLGFETYNRLQTWHLMLLTVPYNREYPIQRNHKVPYLPPLR